MNRNRLVAFGALLALSAAGCSAGSDTNPSPGGGGDTGSGDGSYSLAFIQGVAGDEFYISMGCGIQDKAEELGATVEIQGPQKFDAALQTPIVDSVAASKPDAILIAPTDVSALERPIQAAADGGAKIVLVDTTLENPSMAASQISSDNLGGGAAAFEAIKQLKPEGGKVLVVSVQPGISTTDQRAQGFEDAVATDSKFTSLGVQYSNNEPAKAAQIVNAALQKDPDIVGIFAANLFSAEGAATGLRQAGRDDITIVGFDAGPAQVKALEDGTVQALIAQKPYDIGVQGVEQAIAAIDGESTTPEIKTDFVIVTRDNMSDPEVEKYLYKSDC